MKTNEIKYWIGAAEDGSTVLYVNDNGRRFVYDDQGKYTRLPAEFEDEDDYAEYLKELISECRNWDWTSDGWDEVCEDETEYIDFRMPHFQEII